MTVEEMLARISSHELTEWQAYEKETGYLGPEWEREVARQIHYYVQVSALAQAQAKKDPKMFPAPNEVFSALGEEDWVPLVEEE